MTRKDTVELRIRLDRSELSKGITASRREFKALGGDVIAESRRMESAFSGISRGMMGIAGAWSLKEFAKDVIKVRGEMQSMETVIKTFVGEAEGLKILSELRELAKNSPLTMTDFTEGEKTLLNFNIASDKTVGYLKALSDISMGNSERFKSLTLAFSQMSATGHLMGQDLNQMINVGFNPLQQIAVTTGKSIATLKQEMSEGAISAEMVQQAFIDATSAGGQFHNMSTNVSKDINGQLSMLEDAFDTMLNEMGEVSQEAIISGIQGTTTLIENYEAVGSTLVGLIATYGTYKAAVLVCIAIENMRTLGLKNGLQYSWLQVKATKAMTVAQLAYNKAVGAIKAHPYALLATAVIAAAVGVYRLATAEDELEKAHRRVNDAVAEFNAANSTEQANIEMLFNALRDATEGTQAYELAKNSIIDRYGEYLSGLINEQNELLNVEAAYLRVKKAAEESARARQLEKSTDTAKEEYQKKYDKATKEILEALQTRMGKDNPAVNTLYERIKLEFEEFGWITTKTTDEINKAFGNKLLGFEQFSGRKIWEKDQDTFKDWFGLDDDSVEGIKEALHDMSEARRTFDTETSEINLRLGVSTNEFEGKTKEELSKIKAAIQDSMGLGEESIEVYIGGRLETVYENASAAELALLKIDRALKAIEANKGLPSLSQSLANAKKAMEDAKKAWDDGKDKNLDAGTVDKLRKDYESKKKIYENLQKTAGHDTKASNARLKAEDKANKELLVLQQQNTKERIALMKDGSAKQLELIDAEYKEKIAKLQEQEKKWKDAQGGKLTDEQKKAVTDGKSLALRTKQHDETDVYAREAEAMRDFLAEYGTFQQQKYAIAQSYAKKIAEATSDGERRKLTHERDDRLHEVEVKALTADINWEAVWSSFGGMFNGVIEDQLSHLEEFTKTDDFKGRSIEDQRGIYETIDELRGKLGEFDATLDFGQLGKDIEAYRKAQTELISAQEAEKVALEAVAQAEAELATARKGGDKKEIDNAEFALSQAQQGAVEATNKVKEQSQNVAEAQQTMNDTASNIAETMNGIVGGLQKMTSGSISGIMDGVGEFSKSMGGVGSSIAAVVSDPLLKMVFSLLDLFKDGISTFFIQLFDTIFSTITNILDDILSGDFAIKTTESLIKGIGSVFESLIDGIGNIVTLGAFGGISDALSGSNAKEVQETIDRLTDRNEHLQTAIESLTDEMKASKGTKSVDAYRQARDLQKEVNENTLEMARAQAGYHGSHHSWNYYWGGFTADEIERMSKAIGRSWDGSLWSLSPEEMEMLRSFPDIWERIQDTGKGGYGDRLAEKLDSYIDQAGKLEELQNSLYEGLTGISFDSMYDSFIDNLMDMKYGAKEAAEDISEYFTRAMLSNKIGEMLSDDLENWWEKFGASMEDGDLTKAERDALMNEYLGYMEEATELRDRIFEATGYNKTSGASQGSSKSVSVTASQESIDEMNGRATGIQISVEDIKVQNTMMGADIAVMKIDLSIMRQHTDEMRGLSLMAINHLADISRNTYQLYEMNERLGKIEKNTRNI